MRSNIILIGFMGSGKSTVGKQLALELNYEFIDTDELIQKKMGMTIPEFFNLKGEEAFRDEERKLSEQLGNRVNLVIATGGGVILNSHNLTFLSKNGIIFYLKCKYNTILQRLNGTNYRPLYSNNNQIQFKALFSSREILYQKYANFTVETDKKKIEDILKEIIRIIEK